MEVLGSQIEKSKKLQSRESLEDYRHPFDFARVAKGRRAH